MIQAGCFLKSLLGFRVYRSFLLNCSSPQRFYLGSSIWWAGPGCWCSARGQEERGGRGRGCLSIRLLWMQARGPLVSGWCWLHLCPVTPGPETFSFTTSRESASGECWGQGGAVAPSMWVGNLTQAAWFGPFGLNFQRLLCSCLFLEPLRMQACVLGWFSALASACFPLPKTVTPILSSSEPNLCYPQLL